MYRYKATIVFLVAKYNTPERIEREVAKIKSFISKRKGCFGANEISTPHSRFIDVEFPFTLNKIALMQLKRKLPRDYSIYNGWIDEKV